MGARNDASARAAGHLVDVSVRVSRHSTLYAAGGGIGLALALVNAIVLTRYLTPAEFGQLAVLLLFAALTTIALNLPFLPGVMRRTFGASGEDDGGDEDEDGERAVDPQRILGTGLVLTAAVGALVVGVITLLAGPLADLLGTSFDDAAELVPVAGLSGVLGAIWRLTTNALRMERRPIAYVALGAVRPILVLAIIWSFVAADGGLEGAVWGTVIGTAAAVLISLVVLRRSYRITLARDELGVILRWSIAFIPVVAGFWVIQNVDLFILTAYVSDEDLGFYRLASRIAAVGSYLSAAIFTAWMPIEQTPAMRAVDAARGREAVRGSLITYFVVIMAGLLLVMSLLADVLVRVAPPAYAEAGPLIPPLAAAFVMQGLVVAVYRSTSFRQRGRTYKILVGLSAIAFLPVCALLSAEYGTMGAALSMSVVLVFPAIALWVLSQRSGKPVPFEYGRLLTALAVGALCYGAARGGSALAPEFGVVFDALAIVLFPLLVVAVVVPRGHVEPLALVLRRALSRGDHSEFEERVARLSPEERDALLSTRVAPGAEPTEDDLRRATAAIVTLADVSADLATDELATQYVLGDVPEVERQAIARRLYARGIAPDDVARLERVGSALRRMSR